MENARGATLMVLAMLGFALEDMLIKLLGDAVSVGQMLFMLGCGGALAFGGIVRAQRDALFSRDMLTIPIFLRAVGEMVGTVCFVSAIVLTDLSSASAILQATPLLVTLGAALFLGETVGWRRWSAITMGLIGVLLIIRPGFDSFEVLSLLAVGGALCLCLRDLATRSVPSSISTMQLSFLGFVVVIPAGGALLLVTGTPLEALSGQSWLIFAMALTVGLFAYYGVVSAMRVGEISFVTPFRYSRLLFALILGVTVFGETPDGLTLIGAAVIVGSGVYMVLRERQLRQTA
ncbi:MAG: DMT family transporter [Pseudomonadota bacterium]